MPLRPTSNEPRSLGTRVVSSARKHAARSGLIAGLINLLRGRTVPSFLIARAAANGLIGQELELVCRQAGRWDELPHIFSTIAGELLEKAMYWEDLGLGPRAGSHYLQSALWDFYAQLLLPQDLDTRALTYARCAQTYRRAAPLFEYPAQSVEIACQSGFLKGYLRLPGPEVEKPYPCTIIVNTINSVKEELHYAENAFLKMGVATLAFDLPGFGQSVGEGLDTCDFGLVGNALYLFLAQHTLINPERLALHGIGIGGALALHLGALCPRRYRAVATLSAPLSVAASLERILPAVRREAICLTRGAEQLLYDFARRLWTDETLSELDLPLLVAGGGKDLLVKEKETRLLYSQASSADKKLLFCPNAGHGCYEMMPSLRYEIAQWIKQRI